MALQRSSKQSTHRSTKSLPKTTRRSQSGSAKEPAETFKPAGRGGPSQAAGGPRHHGGDAREDRNP